MKQAEPTAALQTLEQVALVLSKDEVALVDRALLNLQARAANKARFHNQKAEEFAGYAEEAEHRGQHLKRNINRDAADHNRGQALVWAKERETLADVRKRLKGE